MSKRTDFPRQPMKRRSHTRKVPQDCVINMAEARKQIAQALQLHRSSSSSSMSVAEPGGGYHGCGYGKPLFSGSQHFCYSILESIPLPQPIWSTTAPSVLGSPAVAMEELETFEWGDGQAAYAWWLGFLKTLDVNGNQQYPNEEKATAVGMSSMALSQCQDGVEGGEPLTILEGSDQSSSTDDWLIIPISEDGGFIDSDCIGNDLASN